MIITRSCSVTITVAQMLLYLRKQVDYRRKKLMCTKIGCLYRESLKLFVDLTLFVQKRTPNRSLTMANAFGLSATNLLFLQVVVKGHQLRVTTLTYGKAAPGRTVGVSGVGGGVSGKGLIL